MLSTNLRAPGVQSAPGLEFLFRTHSVATVPRSEISGILGRMVHDHRDFDCSAGKIGFLVFLVDRELGEMIFRRAFQSRVPNNWYEASAALAFIGDEDATHILKSALSRCVPGAGVSALTALGAIGAFDYEQTKARWLTVHGSNGIRLETILRNGKTSDVESHAERMISYARRYTEYLIGRWKADWSELMQDWL